MLPQMHKEARMEWEEFDARMDYRRSKRQRGKNMALLRVIGGILTLFFYVFLGIGLIVAFGIAWVHPFLGALLGVCIGAGVLNAWVQRKR